MKMAIRIFFLNMTQGPPNPEYMQEKVFSVFMKKELRIDGVENISFFELVILFLSFKNPSLQ